LVNFFQQVPRTCQQLTPIRRSLFSPNGAWLFLSVASIVLPFDPSSLRHFLSHKMFIPDFYIRRFEKGKILF
jgi:hypothetical protein